MSYIKRYFENHINELSTSELRSMGYSDEEIDELRECFSEKG